MKTYMRAFIAGVVAIGAFGVTAASADQNHKRSASHSADHDRRGHHGEYGKKHSRDHNSHAGSRRDSGLNISVTFSGDRYAHRSRYNGRRNGYRGSEARRVNREVFQTRYRARIVLTEDVVRTRRGPRLVCNVTARGPEARYVSDRRMRRIANRNCSRRARINIYS